MEHIAKIKSECKRTMEQAMVMELVLVQELAGHLFVVPAGKIFISAYSDDSRKMTSSSYSIRSIELWHV